MRIYQKDILKLHAKDRRENTVRIKPMVTTDKKKKQNKLECRNYGKY
jgi:hypothetical protein